MNVLAAFKSGTLLDRHASATVNPLAADPLDNAPTEVREDVVIPLARLVPPRALPR